MRKLTLSVATFAFFAMTGSALGQGLLFTMDDPNPQPSAWFGYSLAGVGDLDGDSVPDVAVGVYRQAVAGNARQGQAFVFSGADGSVLLTLDNPNPRPYAHFGVAVAGVGDVDGDSVPDIAAGAIMNDVAGTTDQGQAFVFSGADGSLLLTLDDPNPQPSAYLGGAVAGVGDVDGDSVPDIAVGARFQDVAGNTEQGQAFVFSGADGSVLLTLDNPNPQPNTRFGYTLAGVGDVDGDSLPDIAVGAFSQDVAGNSGQGQAFVFSGVDGSVLLTLDDPTPQAYALFGIAVAAAGDVNGDSVPDIAVGASSQDVAGTTDQGQAFVFSGADGSVLLTLDDPSPQSGASFGSSLAGVGDLEGDSVPDIAVAAIFKDVAGNSVQGQAFVFFAGPDQDGDGVADGVDNCPTVHNPGQTDVNGDGFGDVCVSPNADVGANVDLGDGVIIGDNVTVRDGAQVGDGAVIEDGATIGFWASVGAGTVIGSDSWVGLRASVGDNSIIGSGCNVWPLAQVGSDVILGDNVTVGIDAQIDDGIIIGDNVTIPAGAHIVDLDSDSVSDDVEDGAPNGGDGNNDGTLDSQQDNVASRPNAVDGSYVTLVSQTGILSRVQAITNPSPGDAPGGVGFPYGFFKFIVDGVGVGGATTVDLLLPGQVQTFYKYAPTAADPTDHWYDFLYDGQTGAEINGNVVTLHLVDGLRGDGDLIADGKIVEPGSPGATQIEVFIDIRPFTSKNAIVPRKWGLVPVAILSTADFDALEAVDRNSLTFGPTGDEQSRAFCLRRGADVNRDGFDDLIAFFRTGRTGFQPGDEVGILRGTTVNGQPIEGRDSVTVKKK